jgi:hypothetical protein
VLQSLSNRYKRFQGLTHGFRALHATQLQHIASRFVRIKATTLSRPSRTQTGRNLGRTSGWRSNLSRRPSTKRRSRISRAWSSRRGIFAAREMRAAGVGWILIDCSDYKCGHWTTMTADRWPDDVKLSDLEAGYSPETALAQNRVQVRPVPLFRAAKLPSTFFDEGFRVRSNVDPASIFEPFSSYALRTLAIRDWRPHCFGLAFSGRLWRDWPIVLPAHH